MTASCGTPLHVVERALPDAAAGKTATKTAVRPAVIAELIEIANRAARTPRTRRIGPNRLPLTDPDAAKRKLLDAFREQGTVRAACTVSGIGRRTWYQYVDSDPAFAREVAEISDELNEQLEAIAVQRAMQGSDKLLMFVLRSRRRTLYADRGGEPITAAGVRARVAQTVETIMRHPLLAPHQRAALLDALEPIWR